MPTQRLLADTLVSMGLMVVLAIVGALLAWPTLRAVADHAEIHELVLTDASDMFRLPFGFAVAFALPSLVGWLVALVHRGVTKSTPTPARLSTFVLVPAIAVALGMLVQTWWIYGALAEAEQLSLAPMISITSFELAETGIRWCLVSGLILAAAAWPMRARATRPST